MLRTRFPLIVLAVVLLAGAGVYALRPSQTLRRTGLILGCKHAAKADADAPTGDRDADERGHGRSAAAAYFAGPADRGCETGVESFGDLARAGSAQMARDTAPGTGIKPGDIRRAHALLRYAQSLEDAGRNADAKDIYSKYVTEYPDLEDAQEARIGINRIEKCRP